jgi:osmoprotectant transport system permease protein
MRAVQRPALLLLALAGLLGAAALPFATQAPNRLLPGRPLASWQALPVALAAAMGVGWLLLLAAAFVPRRRAWPGLAVASLLLLLVFGAAGGAARALAEMAPAAARIAPGAGCWLMLGASLLALAEAMRGLRSGVCLAMSAVLAIAVAAAAWWGWFDALSLAREYANHKDVYTSAWARHAALVAAAVLAAAVLGLPLGWLAQRRPRAEGPMFGVLNLLQALPSVALFALLIGPLSWLAQRLPWLRVLGVGGVGAAPAVIALALYALLPMARSARAGFGGVPAAVREAARGMGMGRAQLLWRVELPLARPALLAGLRVVAVQTVGLAAVAALIGAGGLGGFVFQGLGQNAPDLVLLGALSILAMALLVDGAFQALLAWARRRA